MESPVSDWTGFAIFDDVAAFDVWHESVKSALGFPMQCTNGATGEPVPGVFMTQYTDPVAHPEDARVICTYSPAAQYSGATITPEEALDDGFFPEPEPPGGSP